jgi:two-component system response regulator ChvI
MRFGCALQADISTRQTAMAADESVEDVIGVVDDDPLILETLVANLDEAGLKVVFFDNGPAALKYVAGGGRISAFLLDWAMSEMDGLDVLRRLRTNGHSAPVIFLTGYSQPMFEEAALAGGAVDFVDKARSFSIILRRLKLVLAAAKGGATASSAQRQDGLQVDAASARVYWRGAQVDLTLSEVRVVQLLSTQPGKDVTYRAIYDRLRGEGFQAGAGEDGYRANVRAIVKRIRHSFRVVDASFDMIQNYPGYGYRWSEAQP